MNETIINLNLETHLYFARIMKEHAIFLEAGFTSKNKNLALEADNIKKDFEHFLNKVLNICQNNISEIGFLAQDFLTKDTLTSEQKTAKYSGINIDTTITLRETKLMEKNLGMANVVKYLNDINNEALLLIEKIISFKEKIISSVNRCEIFTLNYPLLLDHILHEAKYYKETTKGFLNGIYIEISNVSITEKFWNNIMAEHAMFIRGLLDPSEKELIKIANNFAISYTDILNGQELNPYDLTLKFKEFKSKGTEGLLNCEIKSIILPLLADHVLREANHYLKIMRLMDVK